MSVFPVDSSAKGHKKTNTPVAEAREKALELEMHDLAERITDPKDVLHIQSHG